MNDRTTAWTALRRAALLAAAVLISAPTGAAESSTVVIRNVNGYRPAADRIERFSGLVIVDGKVQSVLTFPDASAPSGARIIDGGGSTLLPGLIDAHGHVLGLGQERLQADLRGSSSLQEALDRVRGFAQANRDARWVIGRGWNQVLWSGQRFPTAADLDRAVADRPVLLTRIDGHAVWANSAALRIAGITREAKDPPGGQIVRDAAGEPTGVFVDTAAVLLEKHVPQPSDADLRRALSAALRELANLGMTGVHDAGIDMRTYAQYEQLGKDGQLPIRVYAMLADAPEVRDVIKAGPRPPAFEDRLQLRAVKAWVDGALGSRGAAMTQDYSDQAGHRGLLLYTPGQLAELAKLTASTGWQLNVHAIGDAGNRIVLDAFEREWTAAQRTALRPRIEHAQVISLTDIPRFARLGVIASIQPTHATSDMNMAEARVGKERIAGAYAWQTLIQAGARLAGGSDFPVELANPMHGLHAAVTRQDRDGRPPGGWYGSQALSREAALRLFTSDAAYAAGMERRTGSLAAGQWADFILIDRDYFSVPADEIDDIDVVATYVAGREVTTSE